MAKKKKTNAETRLELWQHCLSKGWEPHVRKNTLKRQTPEGLRLLDFQDEKTVVLLGKKEVPEKLKGKRNLGFEPIAASPVSKVRMDESGLVFGQSESNKEERRD